MFAIAAVPCDSYETIGTDSPRWLLLRLARYADRDGRAFPLMKTLALAARKSVATISRWLKQLEDAGCFTRTREPGGRYVYVLAEPYRLRWPGKKPKVNQGLSHKRGGLAQRASQEAKPGKYKENEWSPRLRGWVKNRFWLPQWGPRPDEPGCFVPPNQRLAAQPDL